MGESLRVMSFLNLLYLGVPTVMDTEESLSIMIFLTDCILVYPLSWLMGESLRVMSFLNLQYLGVHTVMDNGRIIEHYDILN